MGAAIDFSKVRRDKHRDEWRKAAHEALDALLDGLEDVTMDDDFDFERLSDRVRKEGQKVTAAVTREILKEQVARATPASYVCDGCARTLHYSTMRRHNLMTRHGPVEIERPYFYCRHCHKGYFPTDDALGLLSDQRHQLDVERGAAKLFEKLPYEEAAELFEELTGVTMSDHAMHDLGDRLGGASGLADVLPRAEKIDAAIAAAARGKTWRPIVIVAADGADLPVRPESGRRAGRRGRGYWREAKGFRIYLVDDDRIVHLMSWHQIANEADFGEAIRFAATLIPKDKVRIALLADGAPWIWNHLAAAFPGCKQILDYYHVSEHVHHFAAIQYATDENKQTSWIEATMARLFYGEVEAVVWGLERMNAVGEVAAEEIRKLVGYLRANQRRIDYRRARRGQYPLGSGGVESANKFICHKRMKLSGAWWYEINGNAMLRLRCSTYNGTFDDVFAKYKAMRRRGGKPSTRG